jgi:hypothetical protein
MERPKLVSDDVVILFWQFDNKSRISASVILKSHGAATVSHEASYPEGSKEF